MECLLPHVENNLEIFFNLMYKNEWISTWHAEHMQRRYNEIHAVEFPNTYHQATHYNNDNLLHWIIHRILIEMYALSVPSMECSACVYGIYGNFISYNCFLRLIDLKVHAHKKWSKFKDHIDFLLLLRSHIKLPMILSPLHHIILDYVFFTPLKSNAMKFVQERYTEMIVEKPFNQKEYDEREMYCDPLIEYWHEKFPSYYCNSSEMYITNSEELQTDLQRKHQSLQQQRIYLNNKLRKQRHTDIKLFRKSKSKQYHKTFKMGGYFDNLSQE